jgi:hypothetical protein
MGGAGKITAFFKAGSEGTMTGKTGNGQGLRLVFTVVAQHKDVWD